MVDNRTPEIRSRISALGPNSATTPIRSNFEIVSLLLDSTALMFSTPGRSKKTRRYRLVPLPMLRHSSRLDLQTSHPIVLFGIVIVSAEIQRERRGAKAVPAPSTRAKQGANRMTGVTDRDSAQHRQIACIGRMRVAFFHHNSTACPRQLPTGYWPPVPRQQWDGTPRHAPRETNLPVFVPPADLRGRWPEPRPDGSERCSCILPLPVLDTRSAHDPSAPIPSESMRRYV